MSIQTNIGTGASCELTSNDIIDVRDIIARVEELESDIEDLRESEQMPDQAAADEADEELQALTSIMEDLKGYGGDEQWRGDWYPVTLIRESHFVDYCQELVFDCYDLKGIPTFIHIDWELTARDIKVDYSEVTIDGVTYFYR